MEPRINAGYDDRRRAIDLLQRLAIDGRLTLDERPSAPTPPSVRSLALTWRRSPRICRASRPGSRPGRAPRRVPGPPPTQPGQASVDGEPERSQPIENSWVCGLRCPSRTAPAVSRPLKRNTLRPSVMLDS